MPMRLLRSRELRILAISAFAAALSAFALAGVVVVRVTQAAHDRKQLAETCRGLEQIKTQIRGVFLDNLESARNRQDLSAAQRRAIIDYYERQLRRFAPKHCLSP
jgi:hypothetical protein